MNKKQQSLVEKIGYVILGIGLLANVIIWQKVYTQYQRLHQVPVKEDIFVPISTQKPSYDYLKSITVYLIHVMDITKDGKILAAIGTGSVVAEKDGYFYLLTNQHVCDSDKDNCYVIPASDEMKVDTRIKLEWVKTSDYVDLELWRIPTYDLPDNRVIKGFNTSSIQESVYSVGNYLGMPFIYTEGTMAGHDKLNLLFNMPCVFGCSGSAITNNKGELVAVIYAGNNVPTTLPFVSSFDTAKVIAIDGIDVRIFLGDLIE